MGGPPPSGRSLSYRAAARGVLPPALDARFHGRHLLAASLVFLAIEASPLILHSMALLGLARHDITILVSWRE